MNKFFFAAVVITIVIMFGGVFLLSGSSNEDVPPLFDGYEYFWGDGCPHCAKVAEFFDSWENYDKITISKKEVWNNPADSRLMNQRAKVCEIPPAEVGVPLLVLPDGSCITGDTPIIDHFSNLVFEEEQSVESSESENTQN